jgi:deoxyribonucleoside regulator
MADISRGKRPQLPEPRRDDLIAEVATLYYRSRLDQEEIARRVGVSRSTVSRMLSEALETGVVEIRIRRSLPLEEELQRELVRQFGLRDALVLDANGRRDDTLDRIGRLTARYLDTTLSEGDVLAISWGTGVRAVADGLEPKAPRNVEVIQMLGGAGSRNLDVDGTELARRLAGLLGGRCRYLNVPLVVDDEEVAAALLRQRGVRETLAAAAQADLAIVGIGALVPSVSSLLRAGHLTRRDITQIRRSGAVGDVCGHLFTVDGDLIDAEIARRIVAVGVAALRRIPRVVGIAVGTEKVEAILGAMRSRLVNVLATDDATAREVLGIAPLT